MHFWYLFDKGGLELVMIYLDYQLDWTLRWLRITKAQLAVCLCRSFTEDQLRERRKPVLNDCGAILQVWGGLYRINMNRAKAC